MSRKVISGIAIVLVMMASLASCVVQKECREPELDMPGEIVPGRNDSLAIADMEWWKFYTDPNLQDLIRKTLENNRDLKASVARIRQAMEMNRISKMALFPELSGQFAVENETNDYYGENEVRDPEISAKATLSWEVDLRGALRWGRKKGMAQYLETIEAQRAMQMSLVAAVANAYFELVALDNELAIVKRTLNTRKEGVSQAKIRFEGGLTSETSYQQAQVELATTASLIPELESEIAVKESEIALLAGEFPSPQKRSKDFDNTKLPSYTPIGLPSDLILRRPDIRQAQQRLNAAKAEVGVKNAERFPKFAITLTGGVEDNDFKNLFRSPFSYVLGNLTTPIFNFGKNKARLKNAIARYDEARFDYEKKVLTAFKEVHDAVIIYSNAHEASELKLNLREAARKYVDLARLQYLNGVINYLDVLDAQRKYFDAEIGLSNSIRNEYIALVQLYKALGGGWSPVFAAENDELEQ